MSDRDIVPPLLYTHCSQCGRVTAGGKEFCREHIYQCDYAAEVLARIADRVQAS